MNPTEKLDLDAIEARAKAATLGPWTVRRTDARFDVLYHRTHVVGSGIHNDPVGLPVCTIDPPDPKVVHPEDRAVAAFIAHAREDLPALVAEVRRLRAGIKAAAKHDHAEDCPVGRPQGCAWCDEAGEDECSHAACDCLIGPLRALLGGET